MVSDLLFSFTIKTINKRRLKFKKHMGDTCSVGLFLFELPNQTEYLYSGHARRSSLMMVRFDGRSQIDRDRESDSASF